MPRPNQTREKRQALLPIVARTFAQRGFRRTTTAELAARCGVRENILYRLWPDKKAMFIAAIGYVYDQSVAIWSGLLKQDGPGGTPAERLLAYEAHHMGEFGHYRIVFAGLSETDDPDIRAALSDMYRRFQRFVEKQIAAYRRRQGRRARPAPALSAWAIVGLGTVANIARELRLVSDEERGRLFASIGRHLLEGRLPER